MARRSWSDLQLVDAVRTSKTKSEVLRRLKIGLHGGNFKSLDAHIKRLALCTAHFDPYCRNRGRLPSTKKPLSDILVENSTYLNSHRLKRRLIVEEVVVEVCSECGLGPEWRGSALSLHLDHINGRSDDNRIENLRLLCPNCHSQTGNYAGKSLRKESRQCPKCSQPMSCRSTYCRRCRPYPKRALQGRTCESCGVPVSKKGLRCPPCASQVRLGRDTKADWPPLPRLIEMIKGSSYSAVGRQLGVSDNAVRKHIKKRNGEEGGT